MAVTRSDVEAVGPELAASSLTDAEVTAAIARAGREVDGDIWGEREDDGVAFLAAHYLGVAHPELVRGERSLKYETDAAAGPLNATRFGVEYFRMRKSLPLARLALGS